MELLPKILRLENRQGRVGEDKKELEQERLEVYKTQGAKKSLEEGSAGSRATDQQSNAQFHVV